MSEAARDPQDCQIPDPELYDAYLDGLRDEDIKHIDEMLDEMFSADQRANEDGIRFCDAADAALTEIGEILRRP